MVLYISLCLNISHSMVIHCSVQHGAVPNFSATSLIPGIPPKLFNTQNELAGEYGKHYILGTKMMVKS